MCVSIWYLFPSALRPSFNISCINDLLVIISSFCFSKSLFYLFYEKIFPLGYRSPGWLFYFFFQHFKKIAHLLTILFLMRNLLSSFSPLLCTYIVFFFFLVACKSFSWALVLSNSIWYDSVLSPLFLLIFYCNKNTSHTIYPLDKFLSAQFFLPLFYYIK